MTVLLDAAFPRTVDALAAEPGCELEAWVFEDAATRRAAEARLAALGVRARLRSACKPLLHALLEEVELSGLSEVVVRLPAHPLAPPSRFQLEAYPLAGLLRGATLRFEPGDRPLEHELRLRHGARESRLAVFAPNRERRTPHGAPVLCPCGWLRLRRDGTLLHDASLETEHEQVHAAVLAALAAHPWGKAEPLFEVLHMDVRTGGIEHRLPLGDECPSTRESLHEDLYFGALEVFAHRAGHPLGFRGLRPGQIVPEVHRAEGPTRVRVTLAAPFPGPDPEKGAQDLATAERPLDAAQVHAELAALGGQPFAARSHQGRPVPGTFLDGAGPGLAVTAGQHANECSGIVGALRAAQALRASGLRLAVVPLENPDGYALHARLRCDNPRHMHHAARYTALGDDLEHRLGPDPGERAARLEAFRRASAKLHLSLHGYPAHEWTRPNAGYVPPGFETWTLPRGFFLIMRHHPGLEVPARRFAHALAERLARVPGLRDLNQAQETLRAAHAGPSPFPLVAGIPVVLIEHATQVPPFALVTEYPDETVYGDAFRLAHDVQTAAVLEAASLLQAGALDRTNQW